MELSKCIFIKNLYDRGKLFNCVCSFIEDEEWFEDWFIIVIKWYGISIKM